MLFFHLWLALVACTTSATSYPTGCELPAPVAEASAHPGDTVWIDATGMTSTNDTVVTVATAVASVRDVQRIGCDDYDTCRTTNTCTVCGDCDACATEASACVERVKFTVPDVGAGDQVVTVRNGFGTSRDGVLTVLAPPVDTGTDSAADSVP